MNKGMKTILAGTLTSAVLLGACGNNGDNTEEATNNETGADNATNETANNNDGEEEVDFPTDRVEIIVPYAAGGGTDAVARSFAEVAEDKLGETVSVLNREGGGGAVGMQEGANADPDGHLVTMVTVELLTLPHSGLAQFTQEDFEPVALLNEDSAAITVSADSEWETIDDFIEAAQNESGIQIGNSGTGAIWHLAAAALEQEIGSEFNHVPFDGAAPAVTALLGEHIDAVTVSAAEVGAQVEAGDLRILAVMADERIDAFPDVPTLEESGVDLSIGTWRGLAVPAGTPGNVVATLEEAFGEAAREDAFIETLESLDLGYRFEGADGFRDLLQSQDELFADLIPSLDLDN